MGGGGGAAAGEVATKKKTGVGTGVGTGQNERLGTVVETDKKGEIIRTKKEAQKRSINEPKTEKNTTKNNFAFFDGHFFHVRQKP